ncbi:hypothetical protein DA717_01930 [Piscirickettsiaceae bacterium NZ-RLO2]|nr:hypothetical protein DA717_01930 [Piscirickettsiaceae bacterium NZ-RLO2]
MVALAPKKECSGCYHDKEQCRCRCVGSIPVDLVAKFIDSWHCGEISQPDTKVLLFIDHIELRSVKNIFT